MKKPNIGAPGSKDFHDSSLIKFEINPCLDQVSLIVSTPDEYSVQQVWMIKLIGVLRVEYETTGIGFGEEFPLEIYDIYNCIDSEEFQRWNKRFHDLELNQKDRNKLCHIVLASSYYRGWGKNEKLDGIHIICRKWSVDFAPKKYEKYKYERPYIDAG
ncbi:MAG: hypothetical protein OEV42_21440 [Deltaproteobacteria bacterium]|nr:hypothetical protein [Deltaproteobacteria bacterium]